MKSVWTRVLMSVVLGGVAIGGLSGCSYDRLKKERDALWIENQELRSENERLDLAVDSLNQQLATKPAVTKETVYVEREASANTAFSGIAGVDVQQSGGNITVRVPGDVLFGPGSVALKDTSKKTLSEVAAAIRSNYGANMIRIAGHTDRDPIRKSKFKDNLELSSERAMAVQRYLKTQGISDAKMYSAGYGQNQPRSTKSQSRRVEIVVELQ
ncbi:OmpA/MotB family protein [Poriferisphaera sp. WC338]|uniref:OmpA/MotB family protein n=1 Tax=Poriferisphaera sp. WC338 TaxID=3425129 RepID=UPI003D815559